ncbi:putative secondary metabolism biosynthetic enzyme [Microsporum canis]|uniref:Enoyl reductase (ER) domain-containing protein n=1 Tax=Arthroderma otae (strain ATCC MYA-4605 / CBS 113480) TaxID=554155 RepID=C5FJZ3_ARTOC|nr:conserved hypothetical protein [Microsporum canis CBS 113480]EEQ30015.1 conserved hypothetical protein [Microsporum canis CBS 113480]
MPSKVPGPAVDLPTTQTAIKQGPGGVLAVSSNVLVQTPEPDMVLVRTAAVGLNPTDYKMASNFPAPGATAGCDFAGTIVQLGDAVTDLRVGDRVCGVVHGSNPLSKNTGAFAQYVRVPAAMVIRIPSGVSWAQAAALGAVGHGTVAQALWSCFNLSATPEEPAEDSFPVLVYGGSTSTGTMAIQLLRLSGLKPIAVCSARNFALARSYGAVAAFDYTSPTCGSDIRNYTENALWYALDCISDDQSAAVCYAALGRAGGRYVCLELLADEILGQRRAVQAEFLMGYDMMGKQIGLSRGYERDANPERHALGRRWCRTMEQLLAEDKIKFHPIRVLEGGWDAVLAGLDDLKGGRVSATKLVVPLP